MAFYRCAGGTDPTGNAGTGDVLAGKTFSNADGIDKTGTMTNQGAKTASLNTSTTSYTIPAGYHNGSGKVSITTQEKTVTSSRSAQTVTPDSGKVLSKVTVNALAPTGTYKPTARANNNDMGATGNYRYVDTTAVPNTNSGTYTYAANSTGGTVDMGATNTYRYVNAANVYAKGKADVGLPSMPKSTSNYISLTRGMDAPTTGKWCGINSGVTKMRMYTVSASSAITYKCLKLFKNGSVENVEMATNNTGQWFTLTTNFTNVVGVIVYYSGTLASGQELRVYFE
jgi:hypothetical protein